MADIEKIKVGGTTYNVKDPLAIGPGTKTIDTSDGIPTIDYTIHDNGDDDHISNIKITEGSISMEAKKAGESSYKLVMGYDKGIELHAGGNTITVPDKSGTMAVISDISPVYNANLNIKLNDAAATKLFSANAYSDATLSIATGNASGSISVSDTDIPVKGLENLTTVSEIPLANLPIEANPSASGTANLTKLKVGSTTYNVSGGSGGVTSLNSQTGAITIASGDSNGQIKVGTSNVAVTGLGDLAYKSYLSENDIPSLHASKITSGKLSCDRLTGGTLELWDDGGSNNLTILGSGLIFNIDNDPDFPQFSFSATDHNSMNASVEINSQQGIFLRYGLESGDGNTLSLTDNGLRYNGVFIGDGTKIVGSSLPDGSNYYVNASTGELGRDYGPSY